MFGERGCKRTGSSEKGKILQAALDLIVNQGYYGAPIKDITAKVVYPIPISKQRGSWFFGSLKSTISVLPMELSESRTSVKEVPFRGLHRIIRLNTQCGLEHLELLLFFVYISNDLRNDPDHANPRKSRGEKARIVYL